MDINEILEVLKRENQIQILLSRMEKQFFMRYAFSDTELEFFSDNIDQDIFEEARERFLKKTEESSETEEPLKKIKTRSITPDNRRKILARNFKDVNEIKDVVEKANIPQSDKTSILFGDLIINNSINFDEINDSELFKIYEITAMIIETKGFLDSFDKVLEEWNYREGIHRFSLLCPRDFVNRDAQIKILSEFINDKINKPIMILQGIGGIGKTALIAKVILLHKEKINSGALLPLYFDFENNRYREDLGFYIFFEACQQIENFIRNDKEEFSNKRKKWLEKTRKPIKISAENLGVDIFNMAEEFSLLLEKISEKNQCLLFIFDSLEKPLQSNKVRDQLKNLFRALNDVFEKNYRFRCIAVSRTKNDWRKLVSLSSIQLLDITDIDKNSGIKLLSKKIKVSLSLDVLEQIFDEVGGNPLDLKIAANALNLQLNYKNIHSNSEALLFSKDHREKFRQALGAELIRERLYNRILDSVDDERVRKFVHPGFILRSVDQKLFEKVLLPSLLEPVEQDSLDFENFKQEVKNFSSILEIDEKQKVIRLNPEIRQIAVELMLSDKPDESRDICRRAIKFFENVEKETKNPGDQLRAKAEQIYYHLLSGTAGSKIDQLWEPGCFQYISFDDGLPD